MEPSFLPGDRLWADPTAYRDSPPGVGDVVVVRDPELEGRLLLKRVHALLAGAHGVVVDVRGDHPGTSRDSRAFGDVPVERIVGKVWFRYAPAARRGPIG